MAKPVMNLGSVLYFGGYSPSCWTFLSTHHRSPCLLDLIQLTCFSSVANRYLCCRPHYSTKDLFACCRSLRLSLLRCKLCALRLLEKLHLSFAGFLAASPPTSAQLGPPHFACLSLVDHHTRFVCAFWAPAPIAPRNAGISLLRPLLSLTSLSRSTFNFLFVLRQAPPQWTTASWLGSIGLLNQMGASLTPPDAVEAQQQNQLKALLSLVPEDEGDEARKLATLQERVSKKLRHSIDDFALKIADRILRLHAEHASGAATPGGVESKFAIGEASFELSYASLSDFHNGLEGIIGPPSVHFMKAMEEEHTREHELNKQFTTGNYGLATTPTTEWLFVAGTPDQVEAQLKSIGGDWPAETCGLDNESHRRKRVPLEELLVLAERLNEQLKAMGEPVLIEAEVVGARLYTGPMYVKYNGVLRKPPANGDVLYVTTLHAINSCVIKQSKLTKATKVYRGVVGGSLPPSFLQPNEQGVRGGVERAFMSTTTDRGVAVAYASSKPGQAALVFVIQQGMIDRGADISHFSQYPFESEILFAPYTGVELLEDKVNESVLLAESRFSVNLKSLTLEQNFAKRLKLLKDMFADMQLEVRGLPIHACHIAAWRLVGPHKVRGALRERAQCWEMVHQPRVGMAVLIEPAVRAFKKRVETEVLVGTYAQFNDDKRFQQAVGQMIQLKEATRELALHSLLAITTDTLEPEELVGSVEVFLVLLGGSVEVRWASLLLFEKLQPQMPLLSQHHARTALKVLEEIRGTFKLLCLLKGERRILSQLVAPCLADFDITLSQLRKAGFDLECLGQAGCTVASLFSDKQEPDWAALLAEGFPMAELRAVGWRGSGFVGALEGHDESVTAVCVSAGGDFAATGSADKSARVWSLVDGENVRTLANGRRRRCAACACRHGHFGSDGRISRRFM
eukprot:6198373-Pleurochrysis_carterae.AAC.2